MAIKLPKHKVFDYQPRFYDAEKEKWEAKKRSYGLDSNVKDPDVSAEDYEVGSLLRSGMLSAHRQFQQKEEKQKIRTRWTIIIVLGILIGFLCIAYSWIEAYIASKA